MKKKSGHLESLQTGTILNLPVDTLSTDEKPTDGLRSKTFRGPPAYDLRDLMAGGREAIIVHGEERYRLRVTGNDKLILTK